MSGALLSDEDVGLGSPVATPSSGLLSDADVGIAPAGSTGVDVAKSAGAGVVAGAEGLAGLPGDIVQGARYAGRGLDYGALWAEGKAAEVAGLLPKGKTASDYAQGQLAAMDAARGDVHALPTSGDVQSAAKTAGMPDYTPATTAGKYAYTVGSFLPGAAALPVDGPAALAGNAIKYGVIPGIASEGAGQLTQGTPLEPYARAGAGILGGVGSDLAAAGASAGVGAAKGFIEPFNAAGQEARAARTLQGQFTDPKAALGTLQQADASRNSEFWNMPGAALGENVPGSKPTTGQLTGDRGGLALEREFATADPVLAKTNDFGTGSEQQNAARSAALQGLQAEGDPAKVGDTIRTNLAKINSDEDALVQGKLADAQQSASGIGIGATPEAQGEALRGTLQAGRDAAKVKERALWNAVDPDGTLTMPAAPAASAASKIADTIPSTAKPMSGEESAIFNTAANLPAVAPFSDITALRSRISTAMRQELITAGQSQTYSRLSQLRSGVEDAIEGAAENSAAAERANAASAQSPMTTMESRLKAQADAFQQSRAQVSGGDPNQNNRANTSSGSPGVSGVGRAEFQGAGGPRDFAGDSSVQGGSTLDEAAAARLKAASAATRERAQTFDQGPVGTVLKKAGSSTDYKAPESTVPGKLFVPGPHGAQTAEAYRAAAGPSGMSPLHDTAAESLRREAMTPEGIIDPKKFDKWRDKHQDALRAMPQNLRVKFATAADASQAFEDAATARKAALDQYQEGAAGKLIGVTSPEDVTKTIAGIFGTKTAGRDMAALARKVANNPDAKEGLRKAIVNFILSKAIGTTENGASGIENLNASTFQKFVRDNGATLRAAGFSDREIGAMQAIAQDIQRGQRTLQATKLAGQSNTAQDTIKAIAVAHGAHPASLLTKISMGAVAGNEAHGLYGAIGGAGLAVGEHLLAAKRAAGLAKSATLVRDAMLNPELAMRLLAKAPIAPGRGSEYTLAKMLERSAMFSTVTADREGRRASH